jgi:hypothetical protein
MRDIVTHHVLCFWDIHGGPHERQNPGSRKIVCPFLTRCIVPMRVMKQTASRIGEKS